MTGIGKYQRYRNPEMPFTDSEIRALKAGEKMKDFSAGPGLRIRLEPAKKGGGKSFYGYMYFPPGGGGKKVWVCIGPYGKGPGKWTLKDARDEWVRIRTWSQETGKDPRELKKEERAVVVEQQKTPTLERAATEFLERSHLKRTTLKDYRNMLFNQIIPKFGAETPIKNLAWDAKQPDGKTGRQAILDFKKEIEGRGSKVASEKMLGVMRGVFAYSIDQAWMNEPNPAQSSRFSKAQHKPQPNPSLDWDQLPKFFDDLERNDPNAALVILLAVKILVMTFLRVGSLTPAKWDEFDFKKEIWTIPADRMKTGKSHKVPLTEPIKDVLNRLHTFTGETDYVFFSPRGREYQHVHRDSLNAHLKKMGYKGLTTAHGFRHLALTAGQEVLKVDHEIIQRQMAHSFGDKIRGYYDKSQMLTERKDFMISWCDALVEQGLIT